MTKVSNTADGTNPLHDFMRKCILDMHKYVLDVISTEMHPRVYYYSIYRRNWSNISKDCS